MNATELFQASVVKWLCKNKCPNVDITFDKDFYYALDTHSNKKIISIGVYTSQEQLNNYKQFLYEYGDIQTSLLDIVLPFMHEVGHHFTFEAFNDLELSLFNLLKTLNCNEMGECQEDYWLVPDEMAANIWAINFIKTHETAMEELNKIFFMYWEDMIAEICKEEED